MVFTFEFFRIRCSDNAHATLDRVLQNGPDLDAAKVRAQSMFENMDLPQKPDGFRILDEGRKEAFEPASRAETQGDLQSPAVCKTTPKPLATKPQKTAV